MNDSFFDDIEWTSDEDSLNESSTKQPPLKKYEYEYTCFDNVTEVLKLDKESMQKELKNFNRMYGVPKINQVLCHLDTDESFAQWLMTEWPNVIKTPGPCKLCGNELSIFKTSWRCYHCETTKRYPYQTDTTYEQFSIFKGSFFDGCRDKKTLMIFLYYWLCGATTTQIGLYTGWSKNTVLRWVQKTQDLISGVVTHDHQMIGGPSIVVEIDESKFGKRKYNRGHRVEGVWVFGGVELTHERRVFAVAVPDRTRETLLPIIKAHIAPGSIIRSDFWKAYDIIPFEPGYDYIHEKVNHSVEFVTEEGVHTNTIEGTWSGMKRVTPVAKRNQKSLPGCLFEFIWRRRNRGNLWNGLMATLRDVMYTNET